MKRDSSRKESAIRNIKRFFNDSLLSIAALVLMNCVSQFLIYPIWSRQFGNEIYGNIVYIMSLINIFAVSIGISMNYGRMQESATRKTYNGDYNTILLLESIIAGILCFSIICFGKTKTGLTESLLAALLCVITSWRYYADVEYRMQLNYKGYFKYYAAISAGYIAGAFLFLRTECWPLALIPGEICGLLLVYWKGNILKEEFWKRGEHYKKNYRIVFVLTLTNLITNTIFNGDRLLLQFLINGSAVTIYYLASLVGKTMSLITTPFNSVIIGYLARYKGKITKKMIHLLFLVSGAAILLCTIGGVIVSHILIHVLYPDSFDTVRPYFVIANLTQIIYFVSNVVTTILLRIAEANYQLFINIIYAASFLILCVPGILTGGINGFCISLLIVNMIRYLISIMLCYKKAGR